MQLSDLKGTKALYLKDHLKIKKIDKRKPLNRNSSMVEQINFQHSKQTKPMLNKIKTKQKTGRYS